MPCHAAKYSPAFLFFLSCCCFSFSRGFLGVTEVFVLCRLRLFCLCLRASATPCMRIRQAPPQPTPRTPCSFSQACWVDIQARLVNAHPAKHPPTPLAPFSCFLTCSFVFFFLSGLLGGLPGSFSQRTPSPSPATPCCEKEKRERARFTAFCVCPHLFLRNLH